MEENSTIKFTIQLNLLAASIFFVGVVLLAQLIIDLTRRPPARESAEAQPSITVVGFREKAGGKSYDSFTVFENTGAVYTYWREGDSWRSRPLPNFK